MDLYYGSLQFYAHLEEMRMVCNTLAPPQLQGMEYPSPSRTVQRPHPGRGIARVKSGARRPFLCPRPERSAGGI